MKQFFKYVLATVVGIVCVWIFATVMSLVLFGLMMVAESGKPEIKDGAVLKIELNGLVNERSEENPLALLTGKKNSSPKGLKIF